MQNAVEYKAIVEYICDPNKHDFCKKFYDKPNGVEVDKIPLYWGLLAIAVQVASSLLAGGGLSFNTGISTIGWSLMKWTSAGVWFWVTVFWLGRLVLGEDNETINWLFVLTSNFSMLGPILLYWVSIVLIPVGWIADSNFFDISSLLKWISWIFVAIVASFYQVAWIDDI